MENTEQILLLQKQYFESGRTKQPAFRKAALRRLRNAITKFTPDILDALKQDLGKSKFEGYMTEIGMALDELGYMEKHIDCFSRKKFVRTPLAQFPSASYVVPEPYGNVLIMSPWNYPFQLTIEPLIDAIAAGNTAILKPSNYSPNTARVIRELIGSCFPKSFVSVVEGGRDVNQQLLDMKFDYIFFTGGKTVGRLVMEKAAKNLIPVSLELGGKSPCIVDCTANLKVAAKRIVFGKYLNLGQTCVAPDYLLVQESVKDQLLPLILKEIKTQFGENPLENEAYGNIINKKHFKRLLRLIKGEKVLAGGENDGNLRIAPTVLDDITLDSPVMQEEIFGPILPVLTFYSIDEIYPIIAENPTPLALYLFTEDEFVKKEVLDKISFGGGCINDTIIHLATSEMGFGGVGQSGIGSYHGKAGFDTFTHYKSIVDKQTWLDIPMRYQPYSEIKDKLLHLFLK